MQKKELEVWADSFHEGEWFCEQVCKFFEKEQYDIELNYISNFIPRYTITKDSSWSLSLTVYGSYKSWTPLPEKINNLLNCGKPDFILFDSINNEILFAVEETAAIPTGNQSTQRCERMYGAAKNNYPFWYLISEFGLHKDGGTRRDSIWPSIAALNLTLKFKVPCIVLHYSDINNIENYNFGVGLNMLFTTLHKILLNFIYDIDILNNLNDDLNKQYEHMINFISSQWNNIVDFIPINTVINLNNKEDLINNLTIHALNSDLCDNKISLSSWPLASSFNNEQQKNIHSRDLIKYDPLCKFLESDLDSKIKYSYFLSTNSGSGRPPTKEQVVKWIQSQNKLFNNFILKNPLKPEAHFKLDISQFPITDSGRYHLTTSKNILYLYDKWSDLENTITKVYPRLKNKFSKLSSDKDKPAMIYISNSLKPGRLFGDPFTGQISSFSSVFGKLLDKRICIVYFPHQSYSQAVSGQINKGKIIYRELTDFIIFGGGVAVDLKNGEVL